jgi:hypothetical protein
VGILQGLPRLSSAAAKGILSGALGGAAVPASVSITVTLAHSHLYLKFAIEPTKDRQETARTRHNDWEVHSVVPSLRHHAISLAGCSQVTGYHQLQSDVSARCVRCTHPQECVHVQGQQRAPMTSNWSFDGHTLHASCLVTADNCQESSRDPTVMSQTGHQVFPRSCHSSMHPK